MDTGLLMLRIVVGLVLVGHGAQKLFGSFGGAGLSGTARSFGSAGYWPPRLMAGFAGGAELIGGLSLAAGFVTPLAAAAIIGTMLNAGVAVHGRNGLWAANNGYEYPLVLGTVAATLGFTGAGAVSLDAWLGLSAGGVEAGAFALGIGLVTGVAVLVSRTAAMSEAGPALTASPTATTASPTMDKAA